jgi:50S ribosomal protein L16 3-hydroxylase
VTAVPRELKLPPGIDRAAFLREYWQKRPLLMRDALPAAAFTLTPDELAGLACEAEFESRLITQRRAADWQLRHGPFTDADFAALPGSHWTLLVQDVDKYLPDVARLIECFDFVPGWRIDDIMISYATDQGGVGPHSDAYDVFLMQAAGRRRWRLSHCAYTDNDLLPGLEQRILAHFDTDEEWLLEAGDVLYLPPGVAHWGIAEGACMTYSLGFRAPTQQDMAADWFQHLVALSGTQRLADPADLATDRLGELTPGVCEAAARLISELPDTRSPAFRRWLGAYLTDPKEQFQIFAPATTWQAGELRAWLAGGGMLRRHPFARLAWMRLNEEQVVLFCQGEGLTLSNALQTAVRQIAERRLLDASLLHQPGGDPADVLELLLELLNAGILEADREGAA